jgi:UDP-3-O-[3-hydroxymyristoyl] glucosamine N-acyltransferase
MDALPASPLLIFPCNGNGLEALDCVADPATIIGFVDDADEKQGRSISGHAVFDRSAFDARADAAVLAVPGSSSSYRSRRPVIEGLGLAQHRFATVIHPMASVSRWASVGRNVLIMAGVVITAGARIGDHVCVLPNTVVHNHTIVGSGR